LKELQAIERYVADTRERLKEVETMVAKLDRAGQDSQSAKALLTRLSVALEYYESERNRLRRQVPSGT
jgi:DNA repair exonuclease SbcCD ATPase subunit